ncbi:hypothetical protein DSO57_1007861 [Entomophthora muscae]|uniref:Uncharacterized protein n=1 Tax=Entomophthora muscae TaxID=34485 RepID=A0ACC2TUN1_9FUNG|nr:hypothetical protein DSO57_1007861 [Entomophthora muscae]
MKPFSLLTLLLPFVAGTGPSCEGDNATTVRCIEERLTREVYDQKFQQVDSAEKLAELVKNLLDDRIEKLNNPPEDEEAEFSTFPSSRYVADLKHYYAEAILTMLNYLAKRAAFRIKAKDFRETKNKALAKTKFKENMQNVKLLVEEFKGKIQHIYDEQVKKAEEISASNEPTEITEPNASSEVNGVIEDANNQSEQESNVKESMGSIDGLEDNKCDESLRDILNDSPSEDES